MSVVTKTGDGGSRVPKDSPVVHLLGEIDELNSWLGVLLESYDVRHTADLALVQDALMHAGAALVGADKKGALDWHEEAARLEGWVHDMEAYLPPLANFILPRYPAEFHVARAVCRRAERRADECVEAGDVPAAAGVLVYLNRLSDFLFTRARDVCYREGRAEYLWQPTTTKENQA